MKWLIFMVLLYSFYLSYKNQFKVVYLINNIFIILSLLMSYVDVDFEKWSLGGSILISFSLIIYNYRRILLVSILYLLLFIYLFYCQLFGLLTISFLIVSLLFEVLFSIYFNYNSGFQDKLLKKQIYEIENIYRDIRSWRHDYHNHLQSLKFKLKSNKISEAINYLDELETDLDSIGQLVETGNLNIDAILNSKLSLAQKQEIEVNFKAIIPNNLLINDIDCCALLGNLIDNAIESCQKVTGTKFIRLYLGLYKNQFYISITNSTDELVKKFDYEYISNKRGDHGYGLLRINKIVNKYKGYINRQNEPGVFVTEIMLPLG